VNKSA